MFFMVFVILITFTIPNASAITTEEQKIHDTAVECKQQIRSDDSFTFAEKLVKVKKCGIDARLAIHSLQDSTPSSSIQIVQHQVRDCENKHSIYEMIGENAFLSLERSTLARHCVMLYELDEWQIQDDTRMNSLVNGLSNALQEELDKDTKLRESIVHKSLEKYHSMLMKYK
jgi:hypothetical protein